MVIASSSRRGVAHDELLAPRDVFGQLLIVLVYIILLAGRFTLDRVNSGLPALDLRIIAVSAAVLAYLWWRAAAMRGGFCLSGSKPRGLLAIYVWMLWLGISSLWAPVGARVTDDLTDLAIMAVLLGLLTSIAQRLSSRDMHVLWWCLSLTGVVYLVAAIAAGPGLQGRYSAFGGGPNVFVRVILLATLAVMYLVIVRGKTILLATLPALMVGALLAGSRGGIVAFIVMLAIFGPRFWRNLPRSVRHLVVFLMIASLAVYAASGVGLPTSGVIYDRLFNQTVEQGYDSGRGEILTGSLSLFTDSPLIGTGLDGYYGLVGRFVGYEYPHNLFVATLAESGLLGALLFLLAVMVPLRPAWRLRNDRSVAFYLAAAVLIGVASLFSGDYYDSRFLWVFICLVAIEVQRGRLVKMAAEHRGGF